MCITRSSNAPLSFPCTIKIPQFIPMTKRKTKIDKEGSGRVPCRLLGEHQHMFGRCYFLQTLLQFVAITGQCKQIQTLQKLREQMVLNKNVQTDYYVLGKCSCFKLFWSMEQFKDLGSWNVTIKRKIQYWRGCSGVQHPFSYTLLGNSELIPLIPQSEPASLIQKRSCD